MAKDDMFHDLLPEDVIRRIISFLPTEEAIKTSILSKKWRFIWTTISNLDFLDHDKDKHLESFERYVNSVFLRLDPTNPIDKLSISLYSFSRKLPESLPNWISCAVKHNVKDLTLCRSWSREYSIHVTRELFGCKSLESLRLYGFDIEFPKQGSVCFPNLKFLCLDEVFIYGIENSAACFPKLKCLRMVDAAGGDDDVKNLVRNCPVLEDFSIIRYLSHSLSNVDLCIPQLTKAVLGCNRKKGLLDVQIEAPIKDLKLVCWNPNFRIIVKHPDSVIRAELNMHLKDSDVDDPDQWDQLRKLLKTFDKVKYLSLADSDSVINTSNIKLPSFCNLVRLDVVLNCKNLCMVEIFLNSASNLQILAVHKYGPLSCTGEYGQSIGDCSRSIGEEDGRWMELSNVPKCLISSLERFEITNSHDCPCDIGMIKTMLHYAKVLEKLVTKPNGTNERGNIDSMRQEISAFPRASASCQFEFPSTCYNSKKRSV